MLVPAALFVLTMATPNLAAGLMPFYRSAWGLDPLMVTVVFATYLFALVPCLLTVGRPPTRTGWWTRIAAGTAGGVAADLTMTVADTAWVACLARVGVVIAGFLSIDTVAELVNIGALVAFVVVAIGVLVLRYTDPDRPRSFRVPGMPVVPLLAIAGCVALAATLSGLTWLRFVVWTAVGAAVYLGYGYRHSTAAARELEPTR